jgi:hypothetical protein
MNGKIQPDNDGKHERRASDFMAIIGLITSVVSLVVAALAWGGVEGIAWIVVLAGAAAGITAAAAFFVNRR